MVRCGNCGEENPTEVITVQRMKGSNTDGLPESWCLDCVRHGVPRKKTD